MNQSDCPQHPKRKLLISSQNQNRAFTLTELVVVIATLAVLAMLVLPALAGVQVKGGRMQCANNLRQIGTASMMYATEYRDLMPICTIGGANSGGKFNRLAGMHYTRYVASGANGQARTFVPTNAPPTDFLFDCVGLLYHVGLAGNGSIFFCPEQWRTALGADSYSPLLTTDSSGTVRASYAFNPRIVNATNGIIDRLYQKTSDLPAHKLFDVDYFGPATYPPTPSHSRERGWNVLFTDGSVQFSQNNEVYAVLPSFTVDASIQSLKVEDFILNDLELDQ